MISKLARVRLLAVLAGPLLGVATALALSLTTAITLRLLPNTDAAIWEPVSYVAAWTPLTLLIAGLAAIYGEYDLLVMVTCGIPALIFFGGNYAMNVSMYLPDDGHTFHDICGGIPPFDFKDNLLYLSKLMLWTQSSAVAGIAIKRGLSQYLAKNPPATFAPTDRNRLWRGMAFDLAVLCLVMAAFLFFDVRGQLRLGSPPVLTANAEATLTSATSTPGAREEALGELRQFSDKFDAADVTNTVAMLRREMKSQPNPTNLELAETLILFHDDSGVPLLEDALAHASESGKGAPPGGWAEVISRLELAKVPLAATVLVPLLASPDPMTREEAARALRGVMSLRQEHMGIFVPGWDPATDAAAVTRAMTVALDDSDEMVRYFAVCTLMEIHINPHYPGTQLFRENEAEYVTGWRAWGKRQAQPKP